MSLVSKKSEHLEAFQALSLKARDSYELIGDCLIVEHLPEPEKKTASGIILDTERHNNNNQTNSVAMNKPVWVRVLAVGEGYYDDETGESVELSVKPGDIVMVGTMSVKWFSIFGDILVDSKGVSQIGLTRESEIQIRFKGEDGYKQAFNVLNDTLARKASDEQPELPF